MRGSGSPPEKNDHSSGDQDHDHGAHNDEDGASLGATMHATSYPAGFGVHQPTVTDVAWSRSVTATWPRARASSSVWMATRHRPPRGGVEPEDRQPTVRLALADADAVKEPL